MARNIIILTGAFLYWTMVMFIFNGIVFYAKKLIDQDICELALACIVSYWVIENIYNRIKGALK